MVRERGDQRGRRYGEFDLPGVDGKGKQKAIPRTNPRGRVRDVPLHLAFAVSRRGPPSVTTLRGRSAVRPGRSRNGDRGGDSVGT